MACTDVDFLCKPYHHEVGGSERSSFAPSFRPREVKPTATEIILPMDATDRLSWMQVDLNNGDRIAQDFGRTQSHEFQECVALVNLLKACTHQRDLARGSKLHAEILKKGLLKKDRYLGTAILRMYVKCGELAKAQEVFDQLPSRDRTSWTVLISGYTEQGLGDVALKLYSQMRNEGLSPDAVTYIFVLKACGRIKALDEGEKVHGEASRSELLKKNILLGTALVDMYSKCGSLVKAQEVFDELPYRDSALWTALIAGYAQHGYGCEALNCYAQMQSERFFPNAVTFVCILKACASIKAKEKGEEIHLELKRLGLLGRNMMIDNALVDMYAKCALLEKAQEVFDELPQPSLASWTSLICGYIEQRLIEKALYHFKCMQDKGIFPDFILFACILRACGDFGAVKQGEQAHADAHKLGYLPRHDVLDSAVVYMYCKCNMLAKAEQVLQELSTEDISSWNILLSAYGQHGLNKEALNCYELIKEKGLSPNAITFICLIRACGSLGALEKGEALHAEASRKGLLEQHVELGNAIVDMYAKCGVIAKAQTVFDKLPFQDVISWTTLINGYAKHGTINETLNCLKQMRKADVTPDAATFICILKACSMARAVEEGKEVHNELRRLGMFEHHLTLHTAIVNMYAKCGTLAGAQEAFEESSVHDVVAWTSLISAYTEGGFGDEAMNCFKRMQEEGILPDVATFICYVKACSIIGERKKSEQIHAEINRLVLHEKCGDLGSALINMYAKCSLMARAQEVLDTLPVRDAIAWTTLIAGYVENGLEDQAWTNFNCMQIEGFCPDAATFMCISKAFGNLGLIEKGRELHADIDRQGFLGSCMFLSTALMDMYAKCGVLCKAQEIFDNLSERNIVSWTSLIAAYAQVGDVDGVDSLFEQMLEDSVDPNLLTFHVLLTACSHAGLVEKGHTYFVKMSTKFSVFPRLEHYSCMVDLFSRAGCFEESIGIIEQGSHSRCLLLWLALLGACQNWVIVDLGRWAFEHAIRLDGAYNSAAYACMRNIYAAAGMKEEADKLETLRLSVEYGLVRIG